jgi:gluconokinase
MVILLMGVMGTSKTTVGRLVAARLGFRFIDADDYHPPSNIAKMSRGIALTDEDRAPWLRLLQFVLTRSGNVVLACSALKAKYRHMLNVTDTLLVHMQGSPEVIAARLVTRVGHFSSPLLLPSQLATLEPPTPAEALVCNIDNATPAALCDRIVAAAPPAIRLAGVHETRRVLAVR